jgi:cyclic beta-1,2-glucan synthetase
LNNLNDIKLESLLKFRHDFIKRMDAEERDREINFSELLNDEQLETHGKLLAESHKVFTGKTNEKLLSRLEINETILLDVRKLLIESIRNEKNISPAAVWLLDNFYLIEEQVSIARKHLPKGYSKGLPYILKGKTYGKPRVYDLVEELVSHSDGRVDIKGLSGFVKAYQSGIILTIGELWAIPIMLRLAVIENLRRVSINIALDLLDHLQAEYWANHLIETLKKSPGDLILSIADMARTNPPFTASFVAGFVRKLQGQGTPLSLPIDWLEQQLASSVMGINELIAFGNQKQAANQISVSNSIGTLRHLGATDWIEFVETLSSVDQVLRKDITGTYAHMDFATRDRYRQIIESTARKSDKSETEVALKVMELATTAANARQQQPKKMHIGYYLIDKGLKFTEQASEAKISLFLKLKRWAGRIPVFIYLISISLISVTGSAGLLYYAWSQGLNSPALFIIVGLLSFSGAAHLAISLVNWMATLLIPPALLPRMDYSKGIPSEFRSLVIIPTMLSDSPYIDHLLEGLEVRFLANNEPNLHFGLLTDFQDADVQTLPEDEALLSKAINGIFELNKKYAPDNEDIFFLFHRPRLYNSHAKKWMGYERKRGKLSALNALLRQKSNHEFSTIIGNTRVLANIKFVICLDSDTHLPHEAAWKMIGTMAHPLNKAIYCKKKKRVTEGYGILQPRVETAIPHEKPSMYLLMQSQHLGIDPYTRLSSDVYQDLFGEGSFVGKGIYDVDIFEQTLDNVFEENRILSHDLLEGCYCRSGLLSNVVLYDESPSKYETDIKRQHRWIRGDWQIASWIFPFISNNKGKLIANRLSTLSRWKILDNLRRSLLPLSLMLLLLLGWFVLPLPWVWTLTVTVIVLFTEFAAAGWQMLNRADNISVKAHMLESITTIKAICIRFVFDMAVLPFQAYKYTHALMLANWRLLFSKKKLLQWTPSGAETTFNKNALQHAYANMWMAPAIGIICAMALAYFHVASMPVAAPILILWILAPAISWLFSKTPIIKSNTLSAEQNRFLTQTARKTWTFFEDFFSQTDHWLPPDNFQEQPVAVLAHRTSPTNIGLGLLANLAAYDFGFITAGIMVNRCDLTLQTMAKMDRFQGHFYNWYDTQTLEILPPAYISTVDSGNLIGHLLTLKQGLIALNDKKLFNVKLFEGLYTTADILHKNASAKKLAITEKILETLTQSIHNPAETYSQIKKQIEALQAQISTLDNLQNSEDSVESRWQKRLKNQVNNFLEDLEEKIPWYPLLPIPEKFKDLAALDTINNLEATLHICNRSNPIIATYLNREHTTEESEWLNSLDTALILGDMRLTDYTLLLKKLVEKCEDMSDVSYDFLYDRSTSLLSIGFNVETYKKDSGQYDLMASEARLGIFVAIAQGKLPQKSWFVLGRQLTSTGNDPVLLSWSGSMFEYLMPQLVMPSFENTLLHQTGKATVNRQIEYGEQHNVPWGISESGYNMIDANYNFQYRAFGVPGLGLKRGLEDDLVVAPYASMLGLMIDPKKSCANLQALENMGLMGAHGFYEAIDFTPSRIPRGKPHAIVTSYMAHHQGMSLLSLAYVLLDKPMQHRFSAELRFKAALLLLQERIPKTTLFYTHTTDLLETRAYINDVEVRRIDTPDTRHPEIQLLSNRSYRIMITNAGGGYSCWKHLALNRWREDATKDNYGTFCYIKDTGSNIFWSNTHQPSLHPSKNYEVLFSQGHVEFKRMDYGLETFTEIVVSPEDDAEVRRISISNKSGKEKILEITSYAEVVLATQASDEAHQAFSNLFVQTTIIPAQQAIFCTRRPRSKHEDTPWMFHRMDVLGGETISISYETDRMQFIGRGKTLVHPQGIDIKELSGTQGAVLDPIVAIKYRIRIKPNTTIACNLVYGIGETKEVSEALMQKYTDPHLKKRAFELFWTHNQVLLRQINASEAEAQLYTKLAASLIFSNKAFRANPALIRSNLGSQAGLWSQAVSGDLPIVLLHVNNEENIEIVIQLVKAHKFWQLKGLEVDLVIWNENPGTYRQAFQEIILGYTTKETAGHHDHKKSGNIFVIMSDRLSTEERILFESVAKIVLYDNKGTLEEQINAPYLQQVLPTLLEPQKNLLHYTNKPLDLPENLLFFNGTGGFSRDGTTYKIITGSNLTTPAPWVNVMANPHFGTVVSESGAAYTWALNAHEYRLTPWTNDPVSDAAGEAFYIRDEASGKFWSPTPYPAKENSPYITTHGFGFSTFEHTTEGIGSHLTVFVDNEFPIKFVILKISNHCGHERTLSATGYMDIILGNLRSKTNMHIVSEMDSISGALLFNNRYNATFAERVGFMKVLASTFSYTADRSLFIGRNRNLSNPIGMYRKKLSGKTGAGVDPCAGLQVKFDLLNGEKKEIIFMIGNEANLLRTKDLLLKFDNPTAVFQSLEQVKLYWQHTLGKVEVKTPDMALNILANGWLAYQTMACRLFARSGFYQSGGAYGFRDQLQDVLALLDIAPALARKQIILHASQQFHEGDVQHWWHPPEGRGVRTRCSDDMLWLPFVVFKYVKTTGDNEILKEPIFFLEARTLHPEEESFYDLPMTGNRPDTLYEHCKKAIKVSFRTGIHGLPLIGTGDWNDGMDRIGHEGLGESVWLGFFLYDILQHFSPLADSVGDTEFSQTCTEKGIALQKNLELHAWDGEWYKRAWFDDGTPIGSKRNEECSIDAIAQSWSVLSGASSRERAQKAMQSLDTHLIDRKNKLINLLTPAFDTSSLEPGYIKGYVPGVRENGGQYSHAAIWALMAFAKMGDSEKTYELFNMIQPIGHATDEQSVGRYKVEPYVMAADVYANVQHEGRGGWTWYTGSAGWMYQFIISSLLGLQREGTTLHFNPCFPITWPFITIRYQYKTSMFIFKVYSIKTNINEQISNKKKNAPKASFALFADGKIHEIEITCS